MTKINRDKIGKAAVMIISGLLIAFFPAVINRLFYIVGGLLIVVNIVLIVMKLISGGSISSTANNIIGIFIGIIINALPSFVYTGIPLIAGIIIGFSGIDRIFGAISNGKDTRSLITGIVLLIIGGILIFYNVNVTNTMRMIIGLALIAMGVFNLFSGGRGNPSGKIIDVDSFRVS
ncbi:MAG: DUF308 domain-containing protein [Ruminococcus sp.]|nr:DUF308 domain-containing protein [Ruminococcus sp.]